MDTRTIRVTVYNVLTGQSGDALAAFLSSTGKLEDVSPIITSSGLIHRDYIFKICQKGDGFQVILDAINYKDRQLTVVAESRRLHCWFCKQVGHLAKFCPQRSKKPTNRRLSQRLQLWKMRPIRHRAPSAPIFLIKKDGRQFPGEKKTANWTSRRTTPTLQLPKRLPPEWTHPRRPTHRRPSQRISLHFQNRILSQSIHLPQKNVERKPDATTKKPMDCSIPQNRKGTAMTPVRKNYTKTYSHQFSSQSTP